MIKRLAKVVLFIPAVFLTFPYLAVSWIITGKEPEAGDLLFTKLIEW